MLTTHSPPDILDVNNATTRFMLMFKRANKVEFYQ